VPVYSDIIYWDVLKAHRKALPIDHPDLSVTRGKLEYPTVDVSFTYLAAIGKLVCDNRQFIAHTCILTADEFADKAIEWWGVGDYSVGNARFADMDNFYQANQDSGRTTEDFLMCKNVAGVVTILGVEAVDLGASDCFRLKLSAVGTSLKAYRVDMVTPKITVTDTAFASGKWGVAHTTAGALDANFFLAMLRAPSSPSPKTVAYFEAPVVGEGTMDNPFRAQMPEEIVELPDFGKVNRLAPSYGALIKSDRATGKPKEYTAIVRIFDQPDRQEHLRGIPECIESLKAMSGVKRLRREEAVKRAFELDDELTEKDGGCKKVHRTQRGVGVKGWFYG